MSNRGLTAKQQRFVSEYLIDLNATAAYKRAGYKAKTERTAQSSASEILSNPEVAAAIAQAMAERSKRTEIKADNILRELAAIVFFDPRILYKEDGTLKPVREMDDRAAAGLAAVEAFEEFEGRGENRELIGYVRKVKFWPKVEAIKTAMQHLGMLKQLHEHSGLGGKPMQVENVSSISDDIDREAADDLANHLESYSSAGRPQTNGTTQSVDS